MSMNFVFQNLHLDSSHPAERKLQTLRTKAFFKNLKEKKDQKPTIFILTGASKRYQKAINSKYAKVQKYERHNYNNGEICIMLKLGKYQVKENFKVFKDGDMKSAVLCLIIDDKYCLCIVNALGCGNKMNDLIKEHVEKTVAKFEKKLGPLHHIHFVSSDGNQILQAKILGKEFMSIDSSNDTSKIYNGNTTKQADFILTSEQSKVQVLNQQNWGDATEILDKKERIEKFKEVFQQSKYNHPISNKLKVHCSSRMGTYIELK